jgi:hypothetical protein
MTSQLLRWIGRGWRVLLGSKKTEFMTITADLRHKDWNLQSDKRREEHKHGLVIWDEHAKTGHVLNHCKAKIYVGE